MTIQELEDFLRTSGASMELTCGQDDDGSEMWLAILHRERQDRPPSRYVSACGPTLPETFKSLLEQWNESLGHPEPYTFWDAFQEGGFDNPLSAFDEEVSRWHDSDSTLTIWQWLGMDQETYGKFVEGRIRR